MKLKNESAKIKEEWKKELTSCERGRKNSQKYRQCSRTGQKFIGIRCFHK